MVSQNDWHCRTRALTTNREELEGEAFSTPSLHTDSSILAAIMMILHPNDLFPTEFPPIRKLVGDVATNSLQETAAIGVKVIMMRFDVGARSDWHVHAGGQVIYVVDGEGRIQLKGGDVFALTPGDVVVAEPGEEHWHGATTSTKLGIMSISAGDTAHLGSTVHPQE